MANNKYDFIKELLAKKDLSPEKRERILDLASKEFSIEGTLEERIRKLEEKVNGSPNPIDLLLGEAKRVSIESFLTEQKFKSNGKEDVMAGVANEVSNNNEVKGELSKPISHKKKHHDPSKVNKWLKYFTINNTAIKFSTHVWDDDLYNTYQDFIELLNDERIKYDFHSLQYYNPDLYWDKIYPFLFQNKSTSLEITGKKVFGWGRYKIPIGWQYPSTVRDFCLINFDNKKRKSNAPQTMNLPAELIPQHVPGRTIKTFEDVIDLFKPEIEFRDNQLWVGIKTALHEVLPGHNINNSLLNKLKGCSFYTNTEYVLKAIKRIFRMIKSRSVSKDLQINCTHDSIRNKYILEILHLDSYCEKHINHDKLISNDKGDLSILKTTLLSLCDFAIESRFKNENGDNIYARIDYLYENVDSNQWKPQVTTIDYNPNGFKYILEFLI